MNHDVALQVGNWLLIAFAVPILAFIIFYVPMVWRRPSALGVAILGSKVALFIISATIIARNFFGDLPALGLIRFVLFFALLAYMVYDFVMLMVARAQARHVSKKVLPPDSAIAEPRVDDKP